MAERASHTVRRGRPKKGASAANAACSRCRQHKKRCDGRRPRCGRCLSSKSTCTYRSDVEEEVRPSETAVRDALPQAGEESLRQILHHLLSLSEEDAAIFLRRLKTARDPEAVLNRIHSSSAAEPRPSTEVSWSRGTWSPVSPDLTVLEFEIGLMHPLVYPPASMVNMTLHELTTLRSSSPLVFGDTPEIIYSPGFYSSSQVAVDDEEWAAMLDAATIDSIGLWSPGLGASSPSVADATDSGRRYILCDERLRLLDIEYWTTVPISPPLAAMMISVYLETEHPLYGFFDPDLFIGDLVSKKQDFCSPMLVCSVLSWACHTWGSNFPAASEFEEDFYLAAERLYEVNLRPDDVLTCASLMMMSITAHGAGKVEPGQRFLIDGVQSAERLGLMGEGRHLLQNFTSLSPGDFRMHCFVAWAAFNYATLNAWYWRGVNTEMWTKRTPLLPIPGRCTNGNMRNESIPGFPDQALPTYMGDTFVAFCGFWPIVHDILSFYYYSATPLRERVPLAFTERKYLHLLHWAGELPLTMARTKDMTHHAALLHAYLHAILMDLFRPFLSRSQRLFSFATEFADTKAIFTCSALQLKDLCKFYYSKFRRTPAGYILPWLTAPLWGANATIQHDVGPARVETLLFYIGCFSDILKAHQICEPAFKGVATMAVRSGLLSGARAHELWEAMNGGRDREGVTTQPTIGYIVDRVTAMEDMSGATSLALERQFAELSMSENPRSSSHEQCSF